MAVFVLIKYHKKIDKTGHYKNAKSNFSVPYHRYQFAEIVYFISIAFNKAIR